MTQEKEPIFAGYRLDNGERICGPLDINPQTGCFINGIQLDEQKAIIKLEPDNPEDN